jgi:hypothetical protein
MMRARLRLAIEEKRMAAQAAAAQAAKAGYFAKIDGILASMSKGK